MENKQIKNNNQVVKSKFERASAWLLTKLKGSFIGKFFTSYEKVNKAYTIKTKGLRDRKKSHTTKRKVSKVFESSFFVNFMPKVIRFLLRTSLRDYGIVLFTMGSIMSLLYPIRNYVPILDVPFESFIVGIVLVLCSIPLLFSSKSYATGILSSDIIGFILFVCLGLKADSFRSANEQTIHTSPNISFLIGVLLGVISYFTSPTSVLLAALILLTGYAVLTTPESGIIILLFALPFISIDLMILITIYIDICYAIKYIIGKRTLKFEVFDIAISGIMLMLFVSYALCLDHKAMLVPTLINAALVLCYFAVSNLVRSKVWYRRCLVSLTLSISFASIIGIIQYIFSSVNFTVPGMPIFASVTERITSTFYDPDVFAIYLCAVIPFILLFIFSGSNALSRIYGIISFGLAFTCIILGQSKAAFIATVVEILLFLIIYNKNFIYLAIFTCVVIPVFHYTLPTTMLELLRSFGKTAELSSPSNQILKSATWEIFKSHPFGIGFNEANLTVAAQRLNIDLQGATNLGNLYRQILVSFGIFGILILCAFLVIFTILAFTLCEKSQNKHRRINGIAGFISIVGILVSGIFCYSLKSSELVFITFLSIALTFSYFKIERELNKPVSVYVDITAANIDIDIPAEFTKNTTPKRKYVHTPLKKRKPISKKSPMEELMNSNEFIRVVDENTEVDDE